jgi:ornithine--oxo-acid transaminase
MSVAHDFRDAAALTSTARARPKLMTVDDAKRLEPKSVADLVTTHMNPGVLHFMKLLGFHNVIVERAEGRTTTPATAEESSTSSAASARSPSGTTIRGSSKRGGSSRRRSATTSAWRSSRSTPRRSPTTSPRPRRTRSSYVFLGSTGSEAMEAAIKIAEQAQGPKRSKIVYAENSFHGKTKGALSLTDSPSTGRSSGWSRTA